MTDQYSHLSPEAMASRAVGDQQRHTVPRSVHNTAYPTLDPPITDMEKECWDIACALVDTQYMAEATRHYLAVFSRSVQVEAAYYKHGRFVLCVH